MTFARGGGIGGSSSSLTSLGAVGGARGVAAGGLRVLVEFLTTYDPAAIKTLQSDLKKLQTQQKSEDTRAVNRAKQIAKAEAGITQTKVLESKVTGKLHTELLQMFKLETSRSKLDRQTAANQKVYLATQLKGLTGTSKLTKNQIDLLLNRNALEAELVHLLELEEAAKARSAARSKQIAESEQQITTIQSARSGLGARLGGLAIGAIGGVVGGAVLGAGFQLAQTGFEKLGDVLQDMIDPARHARDALKDIAAEVNSIASEKNISQLQAAVELINKIGFGDTANQDPFQQKLASDLRYLTVLQDTTDAVKEYLQLLDIQDHKEALIKENHDAIKDAIIKEAKAAGTYRTVVDESISGSQRIADSYAGINRYSTDYIGNLTVEEAVQQKLNELTDAHTDLAQKDAIATEQQAQAAARAAALLSVAAEQIVNAINAAGALQGTAIDNQLATLGTGVSARTKRLQKRLNSAQGGGSGNADALRNIAEQRQIILLRQRLRLLGTAINLEKYSGKFLLEAINAKIAALQKEGKEQDRLNQLLDLQYRESQVLQRQQGESISDFLSRRAQQNRKNLSDEANLQRQAQIDRLQERQKEVQDEVSLAELAQQRKKLLEQAGTQAYVKELQKRLAASKKHDQKELDAKKAQLQQEKEDKAQQVNDLLNLVQDSTIQETNLAIAGANSVQNIEAIAGRIAGYNRARATLQALVEGFGLPKQVAQPLLSKINGLISQYEAKYVKVVTGRNFSHNLPPSGYTGFAEGGIIPLRNSSTVFGQNVRTGEQGTEIGVVLSHRVAEILQRSRPAADQIGPFNIYGSNDPFRDRYAFRREVEGAMREALG